MTSDEKLSWNKVAGVLLGIAGTAVMIGPGLVAGLGGPVWAKFALIGASLSYALALMVARRFKGVPPAIVATGQLTASTIIMIPVALLASGTAGFSRRARMSGRPCFALALLSTAFAYILYFTLIARAGATNASLVTLIVPVSAILLGALFLARAPGAVRVRRHGADRRRSSDDRRPPAQAAPATRTSCPAKFFAQAAARDFRFEIKPEGEKACRISYNHVALQHSFRLPAQNRHRIST